jgi:protein O-GlcNAc transferase
MAGKLALKLKATALTAGQNILDKRAVIELLRRGLEHQRLGRFGDAAACYHRILAQRPDDPQADHFLGILERQRGNPDAAIRHLKRAVAADPQSPAYLIDLGFVRVGLGQFAEAVEDFSSALRLNPAEPRALRGLGTALARLSRTAEAATAFRSALAVSPADPDTLTNLGNTLAALGQRDAAIEQYGAALALDPVHVEAHSNLGLALANAGRLEDAITHYRTALERAPRHIATRYNLAVALNRQGFPAEAEASLDAVLAAAPDFVDALRLHGDIAIARGKTRLGIASYERAVALQPGNTAVLSALIFYRNYLDAPGARENLAEAVRFADLVSKTASPTTRHANIRDPERQLRVGMVSGYFRNHPVTRCLASVVEAIDPTQIELVGYTTARGGDDMTERLKSGFAAWRDVAALSDGDIARTITEDAIDILIDLNGHSTVQRLAVFSQRPAPIAVTWLGYFASTGLKAIDYVLGNAWVLPEDEADQWVEKPWRLPRSYLCFAPPALDIPVGKLPALAGKGITFGSFNNLNKLSDRTLAVWAQILKAVPDSRLLLRAGQLSEADIAASTALRFAAVGIGRERLALEGAVSNYAAHLRHYDRVDIALDPYPYAGGATTLEALWMGVPVITLKGDRYVAHMGESILQNLGSPDWIAASEAEYVGIASALALNRESLANIRSGLRPRVEASSLCDPSSLAADLETAFRQMWRIWCDSAIEVT